MGSNGRWFTPIGLHVIPKLGNYPVEEITQRDLERVIKPYGIRSMRQRARLLTA